MNWLDGKKTYVVAGFMIVSAAYAWFTGAVTVDQAVQSILTGLGIAALRHGVNTNA